MVVLFGYMPINEVPHEAVIESETDGRKNKVVKTQERKMYLTLNFLMRHMTCSKF
jgi:hypothetical protein